MFSSVSSKGIVAVLLLGLAAKVSYSVPEIIQTSAFSEDFRVSFNALTGGTDDSSQDGLMDNPCEKTPEFMLNIIAEERALLMAEENRLSLKMSETKLSKEKLDIERFRLNELKSEIQNLIAKVEATHTDDVSRLIKLYSNMKSTQAAKIMQTLDVGVAVMVLGGMKESKAAPILANMAIVRAQAISKIIYERSKLPGDQDLNGIVLQ
jgi:flagellar motility protein MotE (MotC chaperone)